MTSVGVVVATFGDQEWRRLAVDRARPSVDKQTRPADRILHVHDPSCLHLARNTGLRSLDTEWVIFLDADDELDPGYIEAMLEGPLSDINQPSTLGVHEDGHEDDEPVLIPERPLWDGNYIVIGAMARRQLLVDVGGFRDLPAFEDWDLWARCWLAGATIGACPEAVYRVHVRANGRRNVMSSGNAHVYNQLRHEHTVAARAKGLI